MNYGGTIVIIEDDTDVQLIFNDVFSKLEISNPILFFSDGVLALEYLIETDKHPFLIFSDINMPKLNGLELRRIINSDEALD